MFDTGLAQLRLGISLAFGTPFRVRAFERVVAAMRETIEEFGYLDSAAADMVKGPALDPAARQAIQLKRFRKQALAAARHTRFYAERFAALGLDPARLRFEDVATIPVTPKDALRRDPDAFVNQTA